MKFSKVIYLLFVLSVFSCGDDDETSPMPPQGDDIKPTSVINVEEVLARAAGSDITDLVTFGTDPSVSASDYLSEVEEFDTFILESPSGLAPGDEFLFYDIIFKNELNEPIDVGDEDYIIAGYLEAVLPDDVTDMTRDDYYDQNMIPAINFRVIDVEDNEDVNWKYDIECYIRRGGDDFGPYIIDPKMRIKRRN